MDRKSIGPRFPLFPHIRHPPGGGQKFDVGRAETAAGVEIGGVLRRRASRPFQGEGSFDRVTAA
jgi:hypothetical protein